MKRPHPHLPELGRSPLTPGARCIPRLFLVALVLLWGCGSPTQDQQDTDGRSPELSVYTTVLPLAGFVDQVAGNLVTVEVLVGPGQSPATWEPTLKQVDGLLQADVLFRTGLPLENSLIPKISAMSGTLRIVDLRKGIRTSAAQGEGETANGQHKEQGESLPQVGDEDPHVWMSPRLASLQAATVCETLTELRPRYATVFKANLEVFQARLKLLDQRIAHALSPFAGGEFIVYHPALGYFARAYGLRQVSVELGGKEPGPQRLEALIRRAREHDIHTILVQPQFSTSSARALAARIDGVVVKVDPLARDYVPNMEKVASAVQSALDATKTNAGRNRNGATP